MRKLNDDGLEERKYPTKDGFELLLENKESVLKTIDDNILDKEVALLLITQLERDAQRHLEEGENVLIPYIGTIKRKTGSIVYQENKEVIAAAKETMTQDEFDTFKAEMMHDAVVRQNFNKVFKYQVSRMANKNGKAYWKTVRELGTPKANLRFYFVTKLHYSEPWTETD